jgi:hypothetical protein
MFEATRTGNETFRKKGYIIYGALGWGKFLAFAKWGGRGVRKCESGPKAGNVREMNNIMRDER